MSIRRNKNTGIWQIDLRAPGGERIRRSAETTHRAEAQEYHDRLKAQLWRQSKLGESIERTFEEAAVRFLRHSAGQRDYIAKVRHIAYWRSVFAGRSVRSLKTDDILDALPTHKVHPTQPATPLANATLNRYLSTLRRMLNLCVQWEWIDRAPRLTPFHEPRVRVRWEPPETIARLIQAIALPWMRDAALVAVATGLRESELFGLTPAHIDLPQRNTWVTHENAKSGRARSVPLNDDAISIIRRRMDNGQPWIFTRDGRSTRIGQHDARVFNRACAAIGIEDFHWHDLRHTWASWHVQNGTPLLALQALGGWETIEMVRKYAHLAPSHLAHHAETVNFWSNTVEAKKMPLEEAA